MLDILTLEASIISERLYDTCVLCTAAHSRPCAALSQHIRIACLASSSTSLPCSFSGSCLQAPALRACRQLFVCPCTSNHIGPSIGFALYPAPIASYPVAVTRHVKTYHGPEPVVCDCGRCICGEPSASQKSTVRNCLLGADFFNLVVNFGIGVCTCIILCCTHRLFSREVVVAAEQFRSLPENCLGSFVDLESLSMEL